MSCRAADAILMMALVGSPLAAQLRGGLPILAPSGPGAARHSGFFPGGHPRTPSVVYLGTPFWGDDWPSYSGAPPVVVVQAAAPPAQRAVQIEEPPIVPVMIELEGDHYVRRSSGAAAQTDSSRAGASRPVETRATESHSAAPSPNAAAAVPATVFVFRDGHRGESSDYAIVSGVIYARGNYWTTGAWTQSIRISDLDLPATLRVNQERGAPFRLPEAPNEVITRF